MKRYIKPIIELQDSDLEQMIAASLQISNEEISNPLGKGSYITEDIDIFGTKGNPWAEEEEE